MPKAVAMLMQDRRQEVRIGRIALFNHLPIADEAVLHLGIVHLVPELGLMRFGLASPEDLGVGLAQAHYLVLSGDGAFLKNALFHLPDRLLNQWEHLRELLR